MIRPIRVRFSSSAIGVAVQFQNLYYLACVLLGLLMYVCLVTAVLDGEKWQAVMLSLSISPLPLPFLAELFEGRSGIDMLNPAHQSWAYLFGDGLVLPAAAFVAAMKWRQQSFQMAFEGVYAQAAGRSSWRLTLGWLSWLAVSLILGIAAGTGFHYVDSLGYTAAGAGASLLSPTKIWHDFVSYPVLFGAFMAISAPLFFRRRWSWHQWVVLGCIVVWALLVCRDSGAGLDPNWLHPHWDWRRFRVMS